ncbi:MAG TPA: endonuclease MutS2 [Armatimonadetes bacterium]|nr:endonuclease MutS2 [Armatimonadota bacterium]
MTERALRVLEFDKIRHLLAEQAASSLGRERALRLRPQTDRKRIALWLRQTTEARRLLETEGNFPLGGLHDVLSSVQRATLGALLAPSELLALAETVRCTHQLQEFLAAHREKAPLLAELGDRLTPCPKLEAEIERCLSEEGKVLDRASPQLANLRRRLRDLEGQVTEKLQQIITSPQYAPVLQEPLITIRAGRYCVPIRSEHRNRFPGLVHDTSASGATVFMEPQAVVELNNRRRELQAAEEHEIERILRELSARVAEQAEALRHNQQFLSLLDLIGAKARLSLLLEAVEPELNTEGYLDLRQARHPLLMVAAQPVNASALQHRNTFPVVPIDVYLGREFTTLLLTGPNTGGKTVTLKTIGLLTLMAQSGLHVPAAPGTQIAVFRQVFADIGDEQSIEQSLSTFSSHLTEIVHILRRARKNSLVLLDEIGAGTDPEEGAALARAILRHLHRRGVRTVATTHYSALKTFAYAETGIENASVEFDDQTLRPTYRVLIGLPGRSQAFNIARRLGLPKEVLAEAQRWLSEEQVRVEDLIRRMEQTQRRLEHELTVAEREAQAAAAQREQVEAERRRLQELERELREQARREAEQLLSQAEAQAKAILAELRRQQREGKATERARQRLKQLREEIRPPEEPSPPLPPVDLQPGDLVRVRSVNQQGTVLAEPTPGGEVELQIGGMRLIVPVREVERVEEFVRPETRTNVDLLRIEKVFRVPPELHLRGCTVEEALERLDKYLDDAFVVGLERVRIVHGKGTGALRKAVHEYLRQHPQVASFTAAAPHEGGTGATVVELVKD